jgi:hypothetical protein
MRREMAASSWSVLSPVRKDATAASMMVDFRDLPAQGKRPDLLQ